MKQRLASPENEWKEFTQDHKALRNNIQETVGSIKQGGEEDPIALVGPYRTGKTQLLYEAFDIAWKNGVPALYTDANTIFNEFSESDSIDIADWLADRVSAQVNSLTDGDSVDWLPNWSNASDREQFIDEVTDVQVDNDQTAILLVDEIEQAYTQIREANFVDDDNPLRVLLDDPEGVYQMWAFGLVAAYELGPADYARFRELRVPILDVKDIKSQLQEQRPDVNEEIAPGIWWLSRGRIGWANKLVNEAPERGSDIAKWVRDISMQEFEGLTPLNNRIWTEKEEVASSQWDAARRAILFLSNEFDQWEIRQDKAIRGEDVSKILRGILIEECENLSADAQQLLERNIDRMIRNIVPISSRSNGDLYIPATVFYENPTVQGFINLLSELILSFEPSTQDRAQIVNELERVNAGSVRSKWTDEFLEYTIDDPPVDEVWILRLDIVDEAFPPVAVDPSRLTDRTTEELEQELDSGISIDPDVPTKAARYEITFCPTEKILQDKIENDVLSPTDFTKIHILFTRGKEEDDFDKEAIKQLADLNRVDFVPNPEDRLWEFVLHLQEYLEKEHDITGEIREADIREILSEEKTRDKQNVISSLFSQLNEIAESEAVRVTQAFEAQFTREDGNDPIWMEDLSGEAGPNNTAPGVYGSRSEHLNALAFSIGVSRRNISEYTKITRMVSDFGEGIERGFVEVGQNSFGFKQFIDSTLTQSGANTNLETFSNRFRHTQIETRDQSIKNLQELLTLLLRISDITDKDIINRIKREPSQDIIQFEFVKNSRTDALQQDFIMGVLLEAAAVRQHEQLIEYFDDPLSRLHRLEDKLQQLNDRLETLNGRIEPPDQYGETVQINSDPISDREDNLSSMKGKLEELLDRTKNDEDFAGIGVVYLVIVDVYLKVFGDQYGDIRKIILDSDLFSVQELEGTFAKSLELVEDSSKIYTFTPYSEEEAQQKLEDFAQEAFDFKAVQGGSRINPVKEDALEPIENHAQEKEQELREFNQNLRQLKRGIDEMEKQQQKLRQKFTKFSEQVYGGEKL